MRKQTKKVAYLYTRKSTDESGRQENSLEVQEQACREFCEANGLFVAGVFQDKVSGTTHFGERTPGLLAAVEATVAGRGFLVCHRSDRLSRSIAKLYEVKSVLGKSGCKVVFADEGFQDEEDEFSAMREVLVSLQSQMTVGLLRKRTKEALKNRREKNLRWCRNAPFGFAWNDGSLVPNAQESAVVERMRALAASGASMLGIARTLSEEGHTSRTGKNFSHMTVRRILAKAA